MKYYARIIFTNQVSDWFSYLHDVRKTNGTLGQQRCVRIREWKKKLSIFHFKRIIISKFFSKYTF